MITSDDVCCNIQNVKFIKVMQFKQMFVTAVCVLFLLQFLNSLNDDAPADRTYMYPTRSLLNEGDRPLFQESRKQFL